MTPTPEEYTPREYMTYIAHMPAALPAFQNFLFRNPEYKQSPAATPHRRRYFKHTLAAAFQAWRATSHKEAFTSKSSRTRRGTTTETRSLAAHVAALHARAQALTAEISQLLAIISPEHP